MQKALLGTAMAVSLSLASFAVAAESAPFVSINAGSARYNTGVKQFDGPKGMSYEVLGGYRWQVGDGLAVGVEGGYVDLSSATHRVKDPVAVKAAQDAKAARASGPKKNSAKGKKGSAPVTYLEKTTLSADAAVVGANLRWSMGEHWALTSRMGIARTRAQMVARTPTAHAKVTATGFRPYVGVGVALALTENVDLGISATRYALAGTQTYKARHKRAAAITNVTAGMEVRF